MNLLKMKQFFEVWKDCLKSIKQFRLFTPLVLFAVFQVIALLVLNNFYRPPFNTIIVPIITKFFNESFIHYPNYYIIMPFLFNNLNILLGGLFGIIFLSTTTLLFASHIQKKDLKFSSHVKQVFPKYGLLFLLWLIESIFVLTIIIGAPIILRNYFTVGYTEFRIFQLCFFLFGLFVASLFAYTTAAVVLDNHKLKSALSTSFKLFVKNTSASFLFVAIPNIIIWPFSYVAGKTQFILQKFNPEMVMVLIGVTIFVSIFANFFLIGTLTQFYLLKKKEIQ